MNIQDEAYSEAMDEIGRLKAEIKCLKSLIGGAAAVLDKWNINDRFCDIIAELRKAAE